MYLFIFNYLTIKQWRVVVDVSDFHSETADALEGRLSLISCLDSYRHEFAIVTFTVKHLENFSSEMVGWQKIKCTLLVET